MRHVATIFGIAWLLAGTAAAQQRAQLPILTPVRIQPVGSSDSLLQGEVTFSTEGCTLVLMAPGVLPNGASVITLRAITRLWVRTDAPGSHWQLYPMDKLRAAEPPGCMTQPPPGASA